MQVDHKDTPTKDDIKTESHTIKEDIKVGELTPSQPTEKEKTDFELE